ncbi:EpsG family protein [Fibrobacter sp. UWB7]|uniref:EpsG family protein n=1 Tax=Fibrobacter sp. UWB7 TaxID=1896206 RepID=UPI00147C6F15|nr:EpsG family protein [Fibrobacter sp. UWB7]
MTIVLGRIFQTSGNNALKALNSHGVFCGIVFSAPIVLLLSFRYGIGTDFYNYEKFYMHYVNNGISRYGVGIIFTYEFCKFFSPTFQSWIVLTSIMTVVPPLIILVHSSKSYLWLQLLALFCLYLGLWCNVIRQAIAISFITMAYYFMLKKSKFLFSICVVFAGTFHTSAFLLLPFALLINKRYVSFERSKWIFLFTIFLELLIVAFFLLWGKEYSFIYSSYVTSTMDLGLTNKFLLLSIPFYIPEICYLKKICSINIHNLTLYLLLFCDFLFNCLSIWVPYTFRMGHYFAIAHIFLIPQLLKYCENRECQFLLTLYYVFFFVFYFYITTFVLGFNGINVYQSIFEQL